MHAIHVEGLNLTTLKVIFVLVFELIKCIFVSDVCYNNFVRVINMNII